MGKECVRLTPQVTRVPVPVGNSPVMPSVPPDRPRTESAGRLYWGLRMGLCALLLAGALGLRLWDSGGQYRRAVLHALDSGWTVQELTGRLTALRESETAAETTASEILTEETVASEITVTNLEAATSVAETTTEAAASTPAWPEAATQENVTVDFPWTRPVPGTVTSAFGYREHPVDGEYKFHYGVDLRAAEGDPVAAFADGTVSSVTYGEINGNSVRITHADGVVSMYAHLSVVAVEEGDTVSMGQVIGKAGSTGTVTGPHLHFQLYKDGLLFDPMTVLNG